MKSRYRAVLPVFELVLFLGLFGNTIQCCINNRIPFFNLNEKDTVSLEIAIASDDQIAGRT